MKHEGEIERVLLSKEEVRAFYDKISKVYDLMAEHSEEPMRRLGLEKLGVKVGQRVLEIGFGTGHCLVDLARAVGERGKVEGIDLSPGMLEQARRLLVKEGLAKEGLAERVELVSGDAEHLPYDDASIDAVFMSFTLELFDTPVIPKVLAECHRVLRPAGRLGVVALSREGGESFMVKAYEWTHRHFPNFLDCRPIYVRKSLEAAGFEILEASQESMWVPVEVVVGRKGV